MSRLSSGAGASADFFWKTFALEILENPCINGVWSEEGAWDGANVLVEGTGFIEGWKDVPDMNAFLIGLSLVALRWLFPKSCWEGVKGAG